MMKDYLFLNSKIIVFDLNLSDKILDKRNEDILYIIKNATLYQNVLILTNASYTDTILFCNKYNIKKGYISCSGGAIIYDLEQESFIHISILIPEYIIGITHNCLMANYSIALITKDKQYIYGSNLLQKKIIVKKSYAEIIMCNDYDQFKEIINTEKIICIKIFYDYSFTVANSKAMIDVIESDFDVSIINDSLTNSIQFINSDSSNYNSIYKIMTIKNIPQFNDVLYLAVTNYDIYCSNFFINTLIDEKICDKFSLDHKKNKIFGEYLPKLDFTFGAKNNNFW